MKGIFLIIVNFNCGKEIISCLDSLREERINIIVVDNGSDDGSLENINKYPVKLIQNKKNLGFAAAVNVGLNYALKRHADYLVILNPDTRIKAGLLKKLIDNGADIVSPVIQFKRNKKIINDFGGRVNLVLGRAFHQETMGANTSFDIDYVSGCCMLIRARVLKKIGLFQEKFFLYWEDVDFCLRANRAGFKIDVEFGSKIIHRLKEGAEKSWFSIYHLLRGNLIFINLYVSWRYRLFAYLYLLTLSTKIFLNKILCSVE